jgi:hypothetical protein
MQGQIADGIVTGNGAAINVSLGWIPTKVELYNMTDGDIITTAFLDEVVPFSSGGTTTIAAGNRIVGATSGAKATVVAVQLYSGSFAGGDAAGFMFVEMISGTFQTEAVYIYNDSTSGVDDATATANVVHNVAVTTAAAGATTTSAMSRYVGSSTAAKGFTIGSVIAEEAKLLRWIAYRSDQQVYAAS